MKSKRKSLPKERNPYIQHLVARSGSGIHGKTKKAQRRAEKVELKKMVG